MLQTVNDRKVLLICQLLCVLYFSSSDALVPNCKGESHGCQCHQSYSKFKEKEKESESEKSLAIPVFDCVALDTSTGELVTLDCSTKLEFICENNGFPIYPVRETLACPDSWSFFYQLPFSRKKCIRAFTSHSPSEAENTCLAHGSEIANTADYSELYVYQKHLNSTEKSPSNETIYSHQNSLNTTVLGSDSLKNSTRPCWPHLLLSLLGPSGKTFGNLSCGDNIFICEQDTINLPIYAKVTPDISEAFPSYEYSNDQLTCEVFLDGRPLNETKHQVQYQWFKNGIPIQETSRLFKLGFYWDSTKFFYLKENRQGTYSCGARVVGLLEMHLSEEINYFYSDISTYILTVHDTSNQLSNYDFSQLRFREYKANLKASMKEITSELTIFPKIVWDFQSFRSAKNVSVTKVLLYVKRNESLYIQLNNETKVHQLLQKYIAENKFIPKSWISLELHSADVCFFEMIPTSESLNNENIIWPDYLQTKMAISEPMCIDDWRLVTRECKPSTVLAASWKPFNYSSCSKYQHSLKEFEVKCPDGYKKLGVNLCYSVNTEQTYDKANEICQSNSSYMMDLKIFMSSFYSDLDVSKRFWISERFASPMVTSSIFHLPIFVANETLAKVGFHCASVSSSLESDLVLMQSCQQLNSFICIYQPLKVLTVRKLNSWSGLSTQKSCYNFETDKKATWEEAGSMCRSSGANLLQTIRHPDAYALFKVLFYSYQENREASWWMNLMHNNGSLQWMTSPSEKAVLVDWNPDTDYSLQTSAGTIGYDARSHSIRWNLIDPLDQAGFICEMEDCTKSYSTKVYIEDRTNKKIQTNYSTSLQNLKFNCVPSGWFIANSVSWYKDGNLILSNSDELRIYTEPTATLEDILPYQGYYWCSVDQYEPFERKQSLKLLFRLPGLHTFVLYMFSPDQFFDDTDCSEYIKNFVMPSEFVEALSKSIELFESAVLRDIKCEGSTIHYYIHIHLKDDGKDEVEVLKRVEISVFLSLETMGPLLDDFQIDRNNLSLRSSLGCQKEKVMINGYPTTWPSTWIGNRVQSEEICVGVEGNAIERECLGNFNVGAFWGPIQGQCLNVSSSSTLSLHKLSREKINKHNVLNTSVNLAALTTNPSNLSLVDIQYVGQVLRNIAQVSDIQPETFTSVLNAMDSVIGVERLKLDSRYSTTNVSSKILFSWADILKNLDISGGAYNSAGNNIVVSVVPLSGNTTQIPVGSVLEGWNQNQTTLFNGTDIMRYKNYNSFEAKVVVPENLVAETQPGEILRICIHKNFFDVTKVDVVSPIIDVIVGNTAKYDLDPPVEMVFKVEKTEKNASLCCAFWDQRLNKKFGGWSFKGCVLTNLDDSHVQCSCDHLTSFAVIVKMSDVEVSEVNEYILAGITYIGCAFSIFGLGVIIMTFILFREWRTDVKHKALFHLSLALFGFLVVFVVGLRKDVSGDAWMCVVVAALLHFLMLASFAWMLVEAFMQYLRLVKVIGTYIPRFMQKAALFGWGLPLLIVGVTLGYNPKSYENDTRYCWLSNQVFYYAVAAPVLSMLLMNFVIFSSILYSNTCGRQHKYLRSNQCGRQENIARAKAVFFVSILLGLSWIFGFLAVDRVTLIFQYLFSITTTFQGFFIFVFFVYRQKKTRNMWLGLFSPTPTSEISHISNNNTGSSDVASRSSNNNNDSQSGWSKAIYRVRKSYVSFMG
ncbi:hypothetical protein JTE90_006399 [Oedothorax gibbosus]|uniref:Adhesion G-protein coupled receptor G6 n=1 Tax=Oedothorax gibbosus TaxID=931172 RepID=A0AAV6VVQ4_9ARAC|nr:hypothetical protein JTE90_006399 [Oedothorax gibbosus]